MFCVWVQLDRDFGVSMQKPSFLGFACSVHDDGFYLKLYSILLKFLLFKVLPLYIYKALCFEKMLFLFVKRIANVHIYHV